jgi:hypothetical protein
MQQGGVDNVIVDICTFLHREIFHVDDAFFDKTGMLAEFPQFCHYEIFHVTVLLITFVKALIKDQIH